MSGSTGSGASSPRGDSGTVIDMVPGGIAACGERVNAVADDVTATAGSAETSLSERAAVFDFLASAAVDLGASARHDIEKRARGLHEFGSNLTLTDRTYVTSDFLSASAFDSTRLSADG